MIHERAFRPERVGIIGGGTAGLLTALALRELRPELEVTLVESPTIPIIGVGEATTPPLVAFLHGYLGIEPHAFYREVEPTWKLGIRFEWGDPAPDYYFNYAFGDGDLADAVRHDGATLRYAASSQLMSAGKGPIVRLGTPATPRLHSLMRETRLAYHLDNERLVAALHRRARIVGVQHLSATLARVEVARDASGAPTHVTRLIADDGRELAFDLYVDCTGFRSLLLGDALGVPFESFASSLVTDTAVTCVRPHGGPIKPYTTATTMDAGWCWTIPMRGEDHLGYVFASAFLTPDQAAAELAERFPGVHGFKTVRFRAGRRSDFVRGNVVAIGNAYGFVEPLESTALHMVVIGISRLLALVQSGGQGAARVVSEIGGHWDWLRWFLAVHYRFNRKKDTPFWRAARADTDLGPLAETIADFRANGPFSARPSPPTFAGDAVFGPRGLDIMLLGQGLRPDAPERLGHQLSRADWGELTTLRGAMVERAVPHADALAACANDRRFLDGLVHDDASWLVKMAGTMQRAVPTRGRTEEALAFWAKEHGVTAVPGRVLRTLPPDFTTNPSLDFGKLRSKTPVIALRPRDQGQLAECVQMLARRGIRYKVRGAGHSAGGQTLIDDGVVLDLRGLSRIVADDPAGETVRVEAGLWWLELWRHLRATGRRPKVLTDNGRTSVGGTLAVGGFGDTSHRLGLQLDGVRELVVMTPDGTRHRVRPGDALFDWSLAGRGQLGIVTEVLLETTRTPDDLTARVILWPTLDAFLDDTPVILAQGRFDYLRARLLYAPNAPVAAAAGHFGRDEPRAGAGGVGDFEGLRARSGPPETLAYFDKLSEPPDARWALPSPDLELVLPLDARGRSALATIHHAITDSPMAAYFPLGSSIMPLPAATRFPLAPLPPGATHAVMLALRPEVPEREAARACAALAPLVDLAHAAGGRIYLMGIEPTDAAFLERQFGAATMATWRALKATHDPRGLLNPGLLVPEA